jgi:hypothetical protein
MAQTLAKTPTSAKCPLPDFGRRDNFAGIGRTDPPQSQPKGSGFFAERTTRATMAPTDKIV